MSYTTTEAYIEKGNVTFDSNFSIPNKKTRVLITFIEQENSDYGLYELDENEVTPELVKAKEKVLKKDKSLFTNI